MAESERRGAARKDVWIAFEIEGRPTPPGDSVDHLSLTGAFIRTVQPLPPRTRLVIRLTAPESGDVYRFDGEVIRTITPEQAPSSNTAPGIAIEFLDVGGGDPKPDLEKIIGEQEKLLQAVKVRGATDKFGAGPEEMLASFLATAENATYYAILGLEDPSVDKRTLRRSYYRRCKQFHPDKFRERSPTVRQRAEEAYQLLTRAYETLSDPEQRAAYDEEHGIAETLIFRRKKAQGRMDAARSAEKAGRGLRAVMEARLALQVDPNLKEAVALIARVQGDSQFFLT